MGEKKKGQVPKIEDEELDKVTGGRKQEILDPAFADVVPVIVPGPPKRGAAAKNTGDENAPGSGA